ncbi:DUF2318 domain-containing protein [Alloscardovia theropitheci]|uniref:DUF2318 domain-containing protein n=1 Tax=Alloscardovia theropitheci TaxID=2496842 RepID=A0A4R0QXA1_9BIFI|nr:DUF2318 domain-containing protein [Alloscardovia theropitheci]TCD54180.1 DUF2318 domain-containing protein [Alloscardovia theropitheci]
MLEQFVNSLLGSLAPILLTMVIGAVCKPMDAQYRRGSRFARLGGIVVGIIAAIIFATLRGTGTITQRTIVNFPTLIACVIADALAIIALIVCVIRKASTQNSSRSQILQVDVINIVFAFALALTYFRAFPDVILRVTNFVETGESFFTSDMLLRALGFVLGITASIVVAAIFSSMKSSISSRIFAVTGIILVVLIAAQHSIDLLQILFSTRAIRLNRTLFTVLAWGLNNGLSIVISQAVIFVIPIIATIVVGWNTRIEGETIAVVRSQRKIKRHAFAAVAFSLLAVFAVGASLTYGDAAMHVEIKLSDPEKYSLKDSVAQIKVSQVDDGHLHRFEYTATDGTVMRFLAIKKGGGTVVVVLDACENCGDAGYYEKDGKVICKKCDVAMNIATIGFKGGCNPIPIEFDNDGTTITVQTSVLDANAHYFRRSAGV